jgi:hypothetical protein
LGAVNRQAQLPQDIDSSVVQVLTPVEGTVAKATIGAANVATALPGGSEIVEVAVSDNCFFAFGTSAVDASSGSKRLLTPGLSVYAVPYTAFGLLATHFGVVQAGAPTGPAVCTVAKMI